MKKIWLVITSLIITALLFNVISAESTYIELNANEEYIIVDTTKANAYKRKLIVSTNNVRLVSFKYTSGNQQNYSIWAVSNSSYLYGSGNGNSTPTPNTTINPQTVNGIQYWIMNDSGTMTTNNGQFLPNNYIDFNTTVPTRDDAIYYTYGDGAVGPQPVINYGTIPIEYSQNIFTEHPENNLDLIRWYGTQDNNGNDLSNINLEIQAVAGYFQGSSYADLKTNTFSDWQASTHPAVQMFYGNYVNYHSQEYRWGDVATEFRSINTLGAWFWNIFASENTWYQYGWRYRYRLCDEEDEPLTEWKFIYTGNSYTPSATEILTDPEEPLTPDTVDTINDINNENNTVNNWYINNTVINNNEYNQTYQQNIIQNIYNVLTGTPDPEKHQKANDIQQTIDNAIDTEDNYLNDLSTQLTDLELPDISQQTGLLKALRWVREVHKETIEETLLGPIVLVILTIGLITYLIGRRNG